VVGVGVGDGVDDGVVVGVGVDSGIKTKQIRNDENNSLERE